MIDNIGRMKAVKRRRVHPYERLCPHCDQIVTYKTYKGHKRIYYNRPTGTWIKKQEVNCHQQILSMTSNELPDHETTQYERDLLLVQTQN